MEKQTLLSQITYLGKEGISLVEKAYVLAEKAHRNTYRKSGEPFINHPLKVAIKLAHLHLDAEVIAAALLHDVLEDSPLTYGVIKKEFGHNIASMVFGVSKLKKIQLNLKEENQVENLRKMFIAMAKDIRVVLIKLADRWHNMETLSALDQEKQKQVALETLQIYAPLAHRLGMGEVKGILEDLAFPYAYPEEYQKLSALALPRYEERKKYAETLEKKVKKLLQQHKIQGTVHSRAKHFYSLYKKLQKYNMEINKIYDLIALRIIVPDIANCYKVLGLLHKNWKPLPGKIKDYIAIPKPNGYQSLHTTVFCEEGKIVEFQIRTFKMHQRAEYGIAAHWHYTEQGKQSTLMDKKLLWVKELANWQNRFQNQKDFLENLKIDIFNNRIFVFTPKGDVIDLPEGATPVDFAYQIHSEIGNHCYGAKVNEKMVALDFALKNGDIVEIITQKNAKPKLDWLKFVRTAKAKERIKSFCHKQKTII